MGCGHGQGVSCADGHGLVMGSTHIHTDTEQTPADTNRTQGAQEAQANEAAEATQMHSEAGQTRPGQTTQSRQQEVLRLVMHTRANHGVYNIDTRSDGCSCRCHPAERQFYQIAPPPPVPRRVARGWNTRARSRRAQAKARCAADGWPRVSGRATHNGTSNARVTPISFDFSASS